MTQRYGDKDNDGVSYQDDDQRMVNGEVYDEATQAVDLVKENIYSDKTMKTRKIMVSVNKMIKLMMRLLRQSTW